jgi:hypothetical protein
MNKYEISFTEFHHEEILKVAVWAKNISIAKRRVKEFQHVKEFLKVKRKS